MEKCIFCKIVNGSMPSYNVYEDEHFIGILDVFPRSKGHVLIIPKKHYRWVYDVPEFDKYWNAALSVTHAIQKSLKPTYVSYLTLGLQVPHAHIHVMPRWQDTEVVPDIKKISPEELKKLAEEIKSAM